MADWPTQAEMRQMRRTMAVIARESRSIERPTRCAHHHDRTECALCAKIAELRAGVR